MPMEIGSFTHVGMVRENNEDSFYIPESEDKIKLFLIADGIGGQNHGKLAGMMTVESVVRNIYKDSANPDKKLMLKKAQTVKFVLHLLNGRGSKNRTRISGFGDRYTAFVLYPYVPNNNTIKKMLKQEKF